MTLALSSVSIFLVLVFSLLPGSSYPMQLLDGLVLSGTLRHLVGYSVVAFWPASRESRKFAIISAFAVLVLGVLIEVGQGLTGRDFEFADIFTNACGIAAGCAAGFLLQRVERSATDTKGGPHEYLK